MQNNFKYFYIVSKSKKSKDLFIKFNDLIKSNNNWILDENNYEYLFIFGGDGTFLKTVNNYLFDKSKKIICINGGSFGFYSFFSENNIKNIFNEILDNDKYINPLILEIKVNNKKYYAINEIVISSNSAIECDIFLDKNKYQNFKGTGLLLSTPLGSTARTKSLNGSIIFPSINAYQMIEIEPISQKHYFTLRSPIILSENTKTLINLNNFKNNYYLIIDGQEMNYSKKESISISCIRSNIKIFYSYDLKSYLDKIRNKFIYN